MSLNLNPIPKITYLGPIIESKFKVKIEGIIENKSCSAIQVDSKNVFEYYPNPKIRPFGPNKAKKTQKWVKSKSKK